MLGVCLGHSMCRRAVRRSCRDARRTSCTARPRIISHDGAGVFAGSRIRSPRPATTRWSSSGLAARRAGRRQPRARMGSSWDCATGCCRSKGCSSIPSRSSPSRSTPCSGTSSTGPPLPRSVAAATAAGRWRRPPPRGRPGGASRAPRRRVARGEYGTRPQLGQRRPPRRWRNDPSNGRDAGVSCSDSSGPRVAQRRRRAGSRAAGLAWGGTEARRVHQGQQAVTAAGAARRQPHHRRVGLEGSPPPRTRSTTRRMLTSTAGGRRRRPGPAPRRRCSGRRPAARVSRRASRGLDLPRRFPQPPGPPRVAEPTPRADHIGGARGRHGGWSGELFDERRPTPPRPVPPGSGAA